MAEPDNDEVWQGLEEAEFRAEIRRLFQSIAVGEGDDSRRVIRQLQLARRIVHEEVGNAYEQHFNWLFRFYPQSSRDECRKIVDQANAELDVLGLAVQLDSAGPKPARLTVSSVPPVLGQSWFQLESLDPGVRDRPHRLSSPSDSKFRLVPTPATAASKKRGQSLS